MAIIITLNQIVQADTYPPTVNKYGVVDLTKAIGWEYDVSGANLSRVSVKRDNDTVTSVNDWPLQFDDIETDFAGFRSVNRGVLISGVPNVSNSTARFEFTDAASVEIQLPSVQRVGYSLYAGGNYTFDISGNIILTWNLDPTWDWDIYIDQHFQIIDPSTGIVLSPVVTKTGNFLGDPVTFSGMPLKDLTLRITDDYGGIVESTLIYQGVPGVKLDGEFIVWESNFLKMIDMALKNDKVYDLTFDSNFLFKNKYYIQYCQKIQKDDTGFWIQFQSEFNSHIALLVKSDGSTIDISGDIDIVGQVGLKTVFELEFDFSALEGVYFLRITTDDVLRNERVFESEKFQVSTEHKHTSIISYIQTNSSYGFLSGILWDTKPQKIRVEGEITSFMTGTESEQYEDSNDRLILLSSYPRQIAKFKLYRSPYFIVQRLNLALQHKNFYIEGVEYRKDGSFETEVYEGSNLYKGTNEFRQVEYLIPK